MIGIENKEYIEDFITYLKIDKHYSDNTIDSYERDLREFLVYTNKEIIDVTKKDIDNYVLFIIQKYNENTINRIISSIRSFYKYLSIYKGFINISEDVECLKRRSRLPKYLTIEEVDKLLNINLDTPFDYRNKAILETMYSTGLRASEVISLELQNVDLDNMVIKVLGKGSKERIVPLNNVSIKYLKLYIEEYREKLFVKSHPRSDILFMNNHGMKMTRQGLYKIIGKIASEKNIDKKITPHILRHSFATHLIECGADIRSVQELLGHENVITTEVYTHLASNIIKENYNEYFNRSKEG